MKQFSTTKKTAHDIAHGKTIAHNRKLVKTKLDTSFKRV